MNCSEFATQKLRDVVTELGPETSKVLMFIDATSLHFTFHAIQVRTYYVLLAYTYFSHMCISRKYVLFASFPLAC